MPESRAFLQRSWAGELAEFEIPREFRPLRRRGYKFLAAALRYHLEWLEWDGQDTHKNDVAVLQRVARALQSARWETTGLLRERYDAEHAAIRQLLEAHGPVWNAEERRYLVHIDVRRKREALEAERIFAGFFSTARAQLEDEYDGEPIDGWHPGGTRIRAEQLRGELAERRQPLESRLRDLVRYMRKRGELPPHQRRQ